MTFEKLINLLKFDTGSAEVLLNLDKNIEKSHSELYECLLNAYLESAEACVKLIRKSATIIYINEELLGLWFSLKLMASRMHSNYCKRGIEECYFISASANVCRYIAATEDVTGKFGIMIDRYVRALRHLIELEAFRIGDFNFEFIRFDGSAQYGGEKIESGELCLSLHIPINSDICDENIERNFSLAKEFFKRHFGMEKAFCQLYSWLIHPSIAEALPEEARLVKLYKRFNLYEVKNDPYSPIEYVYGLKFAESYRLGDKSFDAYPEKTLLQRKFKERLIKGLPLGTAKGITLL